MFFCFQSHAILWKVIHNWCSRWKVINFIHFLTRKTFTLKKMEKHVGTLNFFSFFFSFYGWRWMILKLVVPGANGDIEFQNFLQPLWRWVLAKLVVQGVSNGTEYQNFLQPWWRWIVSKLIILGASNGIEYQKFLQPWWRWILLKLVILSSSKGHLNIKIFFSPDEDEYYQNLSF